MLKSILRKDRMLTAGILKIDVNVLLQFYVPWIFYVLWLIHSICFGFFISFSRFSSLIMQICFDQLSRVVRPGISQFNSMFQLCLHATQFTKIMLPSHMIKSCLSHQHNFEHKKLNYVQYLHRQRRKKVPPNSSTYMALGYSAEVRSNQMKIRGWFALSYIYDVIDQL